MALEPEIIPSYSNDGHSARPLYNSWPFYLGTVIFLILFISLVKILIESLLVCLGLIFIWKLATKKT